jgi:hypothetical protein
MRRASTYSHNSVDPVCSAASIAVEDQRSGIVRNDVTDEICKVHRSSRPAPQSPIAAHQLESWRLPSATPIDEALGRFKRSGNGNVDIPVYSIAGLGFRKDTDHENRSHQTTHVVTPPMKIMAWSWCQSE